MNNPCHQAEILAGAIALGEASDAERQAYRGHVATCAACLRANGGENEIERTMGQVAIARDGETWDPDLTGRVRDRMSNGKRYLRAGLSFASILIVVSLALHFVAVTGLNKIMPTFADPLVVNYDGQRIVLEKRSTASLPAATSQPRMVVEHNVVTLTRQPPTPLQAQAQIASVAVSSQANARVERATTQNVLPAPAIREQSFAHDAVSSRHSGGGGGAVPALNAQSAAGAPVSIVVAPAYTVRDAEPLGGDAALVPQPAPIAYSQNASGTSVFSVQIDERGVPSKCTITKSSGYLALDESVCRAAMKARYQPKTVNGKPVSGSYSDAFTFRSNDAAEGVSQQ